MLQKTVAGELGWCRLDLQEVQELRRDKGGTERAENYILIYGRGSYIKDRIFLYNRIISVVKTEAFVSDRMS